jgi:hypothetical protein
MARPGIKKRLGWKRTKANHGRKPKRGKLKSRFKAQRFRSR